MKTTTNGSVPFTIMLVALLAAFGCSSDDNDASDSAGDEGSSGVVASGGAGTLSLNALPLLTPPVEKAVPSGLVASGSTLALVDLSTSEFQSRFFADGPTAILGILATIDEGIVGINERSLANNPACLSQAPVEYTIEAFGQTLTFYGQCSEVLSTSAGPDDPSLMQFAKVGGVTYLYVAVGQQRIAAIVTPIAGSTDDYAVEAWIGVGYLNKDGCGSNGNFDDCSYGVIQLAADSSTQAFEVAVAGIGFGYCGAQLKSDGTSIYVLGSADGESCEAPASLCVAATDLSSESECSTLSTFDLPPLGREAASGSREHTASLYPELPSVVLTGEAGDSLDFGPTTPTSGLGAF